MNRIHNRIHFSSQIINKKGAKRFPFIFCLKKALKELMP